MTASPVTQRRWLRWLLLVAGTLATGLGIAGIFLPLLPSTPFLLLAAACFARSSERAHRWLMTNRLFGRQLSYYTEHRGATVRSKVIAIAMIVAGMGLTVFLFRPPWFAVGAMALVGFAVSVYLARLKTIRGAHVLEVTAAKNR